MARDKASEFFTWEELDAAAFVLAVNTDGSFKVLSPTHSGERVAVHLMGVATSLRAGRAVEIGSDTVDDIERFANGGM